MTAYQIQTSEFLINLTARKPISMAVLNSIIKWVNFKRMYQIELFKKHPHDVQREILFGLLDKAFVNKFRFRAMMILNQRLNG